MMIVVSGDIRGYLPTHRTSAHLVMTVWVCSQNLISMARLVMKCSQIKTHPLTIVWKSSYISWNYQAGYNQHRQKAELIRKSLSNLSAIALITQLISSGRKYSGYKAFN